MLPMQVMHPSSCHWIQAGIEVADPSPLPMRKLDQLSDVSDPNVHVLGFRQIQEDKLVRMLKA
jgi:hypothetical protein